MLFTTLPLIAGIIQFTSTDLSLINITTGFLSSLLYLFALKDMNQTVDRARQIEMDYLKNESRATKRLFAQTAEALASAIDAKDKYTKGHSSRVAEYSRKIAEIAGKNPQECDEIYYAALLHDVGKIGISRSILNKRESSLTKNTRSSRNIRISVRRSCHLSASHLISASAPSHITRDTTAKVILKDLRAMISLRSQGSSQSLMLTMP